jgi:DNA-binding transcriptional MocR family regulator
VTPGRPSAVIEWRTLVRDSRLVGKNAKFVALVLSTHMDSDGGSCFPSLSTLSRETGLARSTVCAALDELERTRLVRRVRGGRGRPTRYLATSPPSGLPLVRPADSTSPPSGPEDVHEDVQKISGRAGARRRQRARAGAGARPDLSYLDQMGNQ